MFADAERSFMKRLALCLEAEGWLCIPPVRKVTIVLFFCFHSILSPKLWKILCVNNISEVSDKKFHFGNQRVIYRDRIFSLRIEK